MRRHNSGDATFEGCVAADDNIHSEQKATNPPYPLPGLSQGQVPQEWYTLGGFETRPYEKVGAGAPTYPRATWIPAPRSGQGQV